MLFHFLNFSQWVCLGIKRSTKLQISKSTAKSDISFKKILFQELQRTARLDYKVIFLYFWYHKNKSHLRKLNGWRGGRTLGWALHISKSKPGAGVFISLYFWWKPTDFRKWWMLFSFHLHSDKAAFVSGARFTGETSISSAPTDNLLADNSFAYIYIHHK